MPLYEYQCEDCSKIFEFFKQADNDTPVCPNCGSKKLKKLLSTPGRVSVKGSSSEWTTCCGRSEPCEVPPCSDGVCKRN